MISRRRKMTRWLLIFALLWTAVTAHTQDSPLLNVFVEGGEPNVGQFIVTLFDSRATFLKKPLLEKTIPVDQQGQGVLSISTLQAGEYAMSVFYDKDMDGELKTGLFGIPKEKVGFSNNAKGRFGPASFEDAKFIVETGSNDVRVTLKKAK